MQMEGPCKKFPSGWACFYKKMNGTKMSVGQLKSRGPILRVTSSETCSVCVKQATAQFEYTSLIVQCRSLRCSRDTFFIKLWLYKNIYVSNQFNRRTLIDYKLPLHWILTLHKNKIFWKKTLITKLRFLKMEWKKTQSAAYMLLYVN